MLTLDALRSYGADVDEGVRRCMGMEEFYLKMVVQSLTDTRLPELESAVSENDLSRAFELAHAMKGVFGNLSLTPLYTPVSRMTELLRSRTETDYAPLMSEIREQFARLEVMAE